MSCPDCGCKEILLNEESERGIFTCVNCGKKYVDGGKDEN
jgi:ribosomal protein L37AE/L43A